MPNLAITQNVADMCLRCGACMESCKFLPAFCENPGELAERMLSGQYVAKPEIAFSCMLCGKCSLSCPVELNIGDMMQEVRIQIAEEDIPLPGNMKYVKNSQNFVLSDKFKLVKPAPSGKTERMFFPACGLTGYSPELTDKLWRWLNENDPDCGLLLQCCATPSYNAGDVERYEEAVKDIKAEMASVGADTLVCVCPDCAHSFKEHTDIKTISLYEILAEKWEPDRKAEGTWVLHEPCKARHQPEYRGAVRTLLEKVGADWKEGPGCGEEATCCGMGGLVAYTDAKWQESITKDRANDLGGDFITYCASCLQAIKPQGQDGVHVLDLLFTDHLDAVKQTEAPGAAGVKANQLKTRELLDAEPAQASEDSTGGLKLYIDDEVKEKMIKRAIREDEISKVIEAALETGLQMKDPDEEGRFIAKLNIADVYYYADYKAEGDGYRILDAYWHRTTVTGW